MSHTASCVLTLSIYIAVLVHRSHSFSTAPTQRAFTDRRIETALSILNMNNEIKEIKTEKAPAPVGPYSQALLVGSTLYCSGSLALDPHTGEFVSKGDIQGETRQVLKNLGAILEEAGGSAKNVIRCTIFLADLGDFVKMNEVYSEFFKDNSFLPTRTCVQAGALPKGALVEIDCIAELFI
jgi:reactive intermediate/imine deaminase